MQPKSEATQSEFLPISFSPNFRSSLSYEIPIVLQWAAIKVHPRGLLCVRYSCILPGQKHEISLNILPKWTVNTYVSTCKTEISDLSYLI